MGKCCVTYIGLGRIGRIGRIELLEENVFFFSRFSLFIPVFVFIQLLGLCLDHSTIPRCYF